MTDHKQRMAEIEARAEKATEGPWALPFDDGAIALPGGRNSLLGLDMDGMAVVERRPDAEFIAHAREDVPYLIARARELEAALGELCTWVDSHENPWPSLNSTVRREILDRARRALGER
jgi:hypothetical protein